MKIGILTFHFAFNYGAVLQAYALCRKIGSTGYDCEIIDYRLPHIYQWIEKYDLRSLYNSNRECGFSPLRALVRTVRYYRQVVREKNRKDLRWERFDRFMNTMLQKSPRVYTRHLSRMEYDAVICGSDQVWNGDLTGGSEVYFLQAFGKARKIAYAASCGFPDFADAPQDIDRLLATFARVSVREEAFGENLRNKYGISCRTTCDPVFLLDKAQWSVLAAPRQKTEDYILVYSFFEDDAFYEAVEKIRRRYGLPVVKITYWKDPHFTAEEIDTTAGPREFLSYLLHARCVVTNSFHGTAFSILLNKTFWVRPLKARERIDSLLRIAGLEGRSIENPAEIDFDPIDFGTVNARMAEVSRQSADFLREALAPEPQQKK